MTFSVKTLAMVLAGGRGERLYPLTSHRSKPAVPFGGTYRLIDFVLSNLFNSGIIHIYVLTQYKAHSLIRHLQQGWILTQPIDGAFIVPVPAQMQMGETWYQGTADAVYQNLALIRRSRPDLVLIFGADHVYTMDVRQMIQFHLEKDAEITVATIPIPRAEASRFGTVVTDPEGRVVEFKEKVPDPPGMLGRPDMALVSMGNYIFGTTILEEELERDHNDPNSTHDFGRDILPKAVLRRKVFAYDFSHNRIPGTDGEGRYWRDVGTLLSYYEANMDLVAPLPQLNLYNPHWPIRSSRHYDPPAKVTIGASGQIGWVENCLLSPGVIISGAYVKNSVVGRNVRIWDRAVVLDSVLLGECEIGEGAHIQRAIIDHGNFIPPGERIGYDPERDKERYYVDPLSGLVVVPRNPFH